MTCARPWARQSTAESTNQDTQGAPERTNHGVSSREPAERGPETEQTQEKEATTSNTHLSTEESVFQQREGENSRKH